MSITKTSGMAITHDRSLEVTVISDEDLSTTGPSKTTPSSPSRLTLAARHRRTIQTKPDAQGESYPYWNEKLHVDLPAGSRYVIAEVRSLVGTARIPVSDFVGGYTLENYLHFLSYRLKDAKGLRNGIINILMRVVTSSYKGASSSSSTSMPEFRIPVDREKTGGTVTGVPVWYPNRWKSEKHSVSILNLQLEKKVSKVDEFGSLRLRPGLRSRK